MSAYSYSQLSMYEECPLRYRLHYIDRIRRDTEGIEAYLGTVVHDTLKKCYDDARLTRVDSLDELLSWYDRLWERGWHDDIVITREGVTREHYHALGKRMIETYYHRYAPFQADITIGTEMRVLFPLDAEGKYQLNGFIDRLSRAPDGVYEVHDYKTSAHLPGQQDMDGDRQLALYQMGVQKRWPDIREVRLVWHFLAFDRDLVSTRSPEQIEALTGETTRLISEIESAVAFPPREAGLCDWCEYPDLCPARKHACLVEAMPANEYLGEPGVALVNRYAELKEKSAALESEMELVRDALIQYAGDHGLTVVRGSAHQARLRSQKKLRFPGKNDPERRELDRTLIEAGKWPAVSQLDGTALARVLEEGCWDRELIERVVQYGRMEETCTVYLSQLKDNET